MIIMPGQRVSLKKGKYSPEIIPHSTGKRQSNGDAAVTEKLNDDI